MNIPYNGTHSALQFLENMIVFGSYIILALVPGLCLAHPLEARTRNEEVKIDGKSSELASHLLKKEHREIDGNNESIRNVVHKFVSSKTANAMDEIVSGIVTVAGGVVDDLGDLMVETINQLPETIRILSDVVGKAVDLKRETVTQIVKGVQMEGKVENVKIATEKMAKAVDSSKLKSSLSKLEEIFASLVGKFIGVTYKNAGSINSAFSEGIKRISWDKEPTDLNETEISQTKIVKVIEKEANRIDDENQIKVTK